MNEVSRNKRIVLFLSGSSVLATALYFIFCSINKRNRRKSIVFHLLSWLVSVNDAALHFLHVHLVKCVGLKNLGRTCFMNAVLQAMAACQSFSGWLDKNIVQQRKDQWLTKALLRVWKG